MQTYDVYLKRRLTEIDVIIHELVQRDTFTMYDWLYLDCMLSDTEIRKAINVESKTILNTSLDNFLEYVHEIIRNEAYLNTECGLVNQANANGETEMVLSTDEIDILEQSFTGGDSSLDISVAPLDNSVARSFGNVNFDMQLYMNEVDTLKTCFEIFQEDLDLSAEIDFSSLKKVDVENIDLSLDISPIDIFYLLTTGCVATSYLNALPIDDYVLEKVLHDMEIEMNMDVSVDDTKSMKYLQLDYVTELIVEMTDVLIQLISVNNDIIFSCEASAGMKRYRLLEEMDDHPLSDFDDMTLEELDYVILAE